jgi:glycosyltransferase involved in cell wall biosynthesis
MKRILFVHNSSMIGGANRALLGLFAAIDRGRYEPWSVLPTKGPMEEELQHLDVAHTIMNVGELSAGTGWAGRQAAVWFRSLMTVARGRVKLIHAMSPLTYRMPALAGHAMGAKCVCHLQFPVEPCEDLAWSFKQWPDRIIACSQSVMESCEHKMRETPAHAHRLPLDNIVVIPNFVDIAHFVPMAPSNRVRSEVGISKTDVVVTIVGLVSQRKGHAEFIRMANAVSKGRPHVHFLVAGEDLLTNGVYRREMEQYARDLGIDQRVHFLGFRSDVRDILLDSDVVVLPSHQEGMPLAILEAAACAKPVVAYKIPGVDEVIDHERTGLMVTESDETALAAAVARLVDQAEFRSTLGQHARKHVEARYSLSTFAERMTMTYDELLHA